MRTAHASPLDALFDYAARMARWIETPEEMANQLAMLQLDVTDADFRAEAVRFFRAQRETLGRWLEEAVMTGELRTGTDPKRLATLVQTMLEGGRILWPMLDEEAPEQAARCHLEVLLRPYRR